MRAKSSNNFTVDDLHAIAEICRDNGIRATSRSTPSFTTGIWADAKDRVDAARRRPHGHYRGRCGGVALRPKHRGGGAPIHATQHHQYRVAQFYAQYADVVVLARELNLEQVAAIYKAIVERQIKGPSGELIRIEMFAHGALCMAVSGKCYLSLHEMNLSANRGACNQICRRGYLVKDTSSDIELEIDNEYIMSPKDLKTIHFLNKMMDAGVRVFKIEGRARGPEYVRVVTSCYKEAVEAYCNGTYVEEKMADWNERLSTVFNRGFWDGYYLGQRLGEWTHRYGSGYQAEGLRGQSDQAFWEPGGPSLVEAQPVKEGDELLITGPTTGVVFVTAHDIRVEREAVPEAVKGDHFSIKTGEKIRPNDQLYKMVAANRRGTAHER